MRDEMGNGMRDEVPAMSEDMGRGTCDAGGSQSSATGSSSSPIPHISSLYVARWRHRLNLHFRVWPKYKMTHEAIVAMKEIEINGIRINDEGKAEVWHMTNPGECGYIFEVDDDDFDLITAIPKAGARMPRFKKMVVRTPGTTDNRVKKECWLDVPVFAYPDASERRITMWGDGWTPTAPRILLGETPEDALGLAGAPTDRIVFFENDRDIDEDLIWREIVEHDAMVVLGRQPYPHTKGGVSSEMGRRLVEKANFWTVPGREPWEDGGALRGYQFPDRIVRWVRRLDAENREAAATERLDVMHEATREKGRSARRKYFLENVVTRFAERIGWPRQRVMARFLDDGIVDWLMRSVDNVKPILFRETSSLLRGRISDAVNALEFYYRSVEGMRNENGGGE